MGAPIAIEPGPDVQRALEERARREGKAVSDVVLEIVEEALAGRTMAERVGHLRGALRGGVEEEGSPWRESIRAHNWRP
ncbi:MAG: hypothetical protein GC160_11670 [Acidobacteria bacterium]|nr:hypothetical protein [Acidobacteriota bacterium]